MFVEPARLSRSQRTIKEARRCQRRKKLIELFVSRLLLCWSCSKEEGTWGQNSLKPLRRHIANNANNAHVAEANDTTPIHLFFLSAYHFHYFHFQFCVLSIKFIQGFIQESRTTTTA